MTSISIDGREAAIRPDLIEAHDRGWAAVASPGTWLTGERRVAAAAEIRHAPACTLCARMRDALSPDHVAGSHDSLGALEPLEVEALHRIVNDPGRLSERWVQSLLDRGLGEGEYVELAGLAAMVMMMDTWMRALGAPVRPLPLPRAGEPSRYRPPGARKQAAWVALVEPEDAVESDQPLYPPRRVGYIYRALSLVPQSVREYWALANPHYMPGEYVYQFGVSIRAISREQTELLAARVSALHQCAY